MGDSDKRYPVLDTPKAWQEYLVLLGMEAYDAERARLAAANTYLYQEDRQFFLAALRTKMADAAQTITSELELAKEGP